MTSAEERLWQEHFTQATSQSLSSTTAPALEDPLLRGCCAFHDGLTRRRFLGLAAGTIGLALTSQLWLPRMARAQGIPWNVPLPRPIPSGRRPGFDQTIFFHEFPPGRGVEPSTITDFRGYFGSAFMRGTGKRTNKKTGEVGQSPYQATMRFLKGTYVATDGKEYPGTFTFT